MINKYSLFCETLNNSNSIPAKEEMRTCKNFIFVKFPFFAVLLAKLPLIESYSDKTMCTNGMAIWYNPDFVMKLTRMEVVWVIVHEIMHIIFNHMDRLKGRDQKLFNCAADYAINLLINYLGTRPDGVLYDEKYVGMSAEKIYDLLSQEKKSSEGSGSNPGEFTNQPRTIPKEILDELPEELAKQITNGEYDPSNSKDYTPTQAEVNSSVKQLQEIANANIGKANGDIQRQFKSETASKVDWKKLLKQYTTTLTNSVRYALPNKRFVSSNLYLYKAKKKYDLDSAIVVFDTSGSITDELLGQMAAETKDLRERTNCQNLYVLYCDAAINKVDVFKSADKLNFKSEGGGGTSFIPAFEWVDKNIVKKYKKVELMIYFTDGYGDFPHIKPKYADKVIWVIIDSAVIPPFGKVIRLNTKI